MSTIEWSSFTVAPYNPLSPGVATGFRRPMRYGPKLAPSIYRLIGAALIGKVLMLPSYFKIKLIAMLLLINGRNNGSLQEKMIELFW